VCDARRACADNTAGGDLSQLKDYVIGRSLWEPREDGEEAIRRFLRGYYSPAAAPYIGDYMAAMVEGVGEAAYYMRESFDEHAPFLKPALVLASAGAFAKAAAAASGRFVPRVEAAAVPLMYVALLRWDELTAYAANTSTAWPYNASKRAQFDEFSRRFKLIGATLLNEGGRNLTWMENALFPPGEQVLRPLPKSRR
jgi:hypothetical protein